MAFKLPAHLHRNRFGTLYFRLTVPVDLRAIIGQAEIYRSLGTASVRHAADSAQTLRIALRRLFEELKSMSGEGMDEAAKAALRVLIDNRRRNARDMEAREELEHRISRMKSEQFRVESEHRRVLEAAQAAHASAVAQAFESVAGSAESKQRVQPRMTNAQKSQLQQDRPST